MAKDQEQYKVQPKSWSVGWCKESYNGHDSDNDNNNDGDDDDDDDDDDMMMWNWWYADDVNNDILMILSWWLWRYWYDNHSDGNNDNDVQVMNKFA